MSSDRENVEWYLARDGEQHGPLTAVELDKFIELGHLRPTDLLWRAGFDDWRGAAEVFPPLPPPKLTPQAPSATHEREPNGAEAAKKRAQEFAMRPGAHQPGGLRSEAKFNKPQKPAETAKGDASQSTRREGSVGQDFMSSAPDHAARRFEPSLRDLAADADRARPSAGKPVPHSGAPNGWPNDARAARPGLDQGHADRTFRPERQEPRTPAGERASVAPANAAQSADAEAFADDEPNSRSGWLTVAAALFVFVLLGAGGLFAYNNQNKIASFYNGLASKSKSRDIEVVRAPQRVVRERAAAIDAKSPRFATPSPTPAQPAALEGAGEPLPELPILNSKLWQFAQREFGDWTKDRLEVVKQLADQKKPKEEVNTYLVQSFVKFRRDNAAIALLASPEKLEQVAQAFVASLRALTLQNADACHAFISNGESTPEVAALFFHPSTGTKLETQMLTIMQAIVDGRTAPAKERRPPSAGDFNKLSEELGKRGWSAAELQLFSDPDALSKAEPKLVCRLVTEWFATQMELADQTSRDQLIAASLRPVIGG